MPWLAPTTTMPWLASASSDKKTNNLNSSTSANDNNASSRVTNTIAHEIQNVRSAIESHFHHQKKPAAPSSPRSPFYEPRNGYDAGISRHPRVPRQQHQEYYRHAPRTADPHLPQYDFKLPDEKTYYSRPDRRTPVEPHPPRYEVRTPNSYYPHESRPTHSPSYWPNEKTPTSPYHPRQPHRTPPSATFHHQVPHTAHPHGSFPRIDPRKANDAYQQNLSPRGRSGNALSARQEPHSSDKRRFGLFDFGKVKQVLSPSSPHLPEEYHERIPSPRPPTPNATSRRDTRRYGYYEHQTPGNANFVFNADDPRTPNGERKLDHVDLTIAVPDDEKYEPEEEVKKKGLLAYPGIWLVRFRRWLLSPFRRRKSRIPSVQPDLEVQSIEELEKGIRESVVLAWLTIVGAWLVQFCTFGYLWSWGVYQDYYLNNFPEVHTALRLSWIGSLQLMLTFALGILAGKIFDAGHFHFLVLLGSAIFGMGVFVLSFVDPTKYMHLFLVQGLFMGVGAGLVFVPTATICLHHFKTRQGLMTGIVLSGGSFGAIVFPIMLDRLLPPKGFGGAVRATSYMIVTILVLANCLMGMPPKPWAPKYPSISVSKYLKERHYALASVAICLTMLTLWFPQYYIEEFAVKHGVDPHLAFYSLAFVNLSGMIGRIVMGLVADKYGPWNALIPVTAVIGIMVCCVVSIHNVGAIVIISLLYGFVSGAWLSLVISALSGLAIRPGEIGYRTGLALTIGSFGSFLTGPAQAGLLSSKWVWARPIGLFAFILFSTVALLVYIRHLISVKRRFAFV